LGTSIGPELLLTLRRDSARPLRLQLEESLRNLIRSQAMVADDLLPSTRTLSTDLGVSRRLVLEAYEQLTAEGYLVTEPRRGTRVARIEPSIVAKAPPSEWRPFFDLRPRTSDLATFPRRSWSRAIARTLRDVPDVELAYPDPQGSSALRVELADYLQRVRGLVAAPERILVCAGFTQALALCTRALADGSPPEIAVEEPGLVDQNRIIAAAGGRCHPVAVDAEGLNVRDLHEAKAEAVVLTPAHQFPTGVLLSPSRRAELLDWAAKGRLVIEDDYDAEFRYDRAAIGALQGLAPENVLYVGSVSKTLAPALRLGWIVAPARLIERLRQAKRLEDHGAPTIDQLALAELLRSGAYDRHLRLLRRSLRRRRDTMLEELDRHLPEFNISGAAAGLHLLAAVPSSISMPRLLEMAHARRLALAPISRYSLSDTVDPQRLVIGYGSVADAAIPRAVQTLAQATEAARK